MAETRDMRGGNGWRLAGKIAAAAAVPLSVQLGVAIYYFGQLSEAVERNGETLVRHGEAIGALDTRVRSLEITRGDGPWTSPPVRGRWGTP